MKVHTVQKSRTEIQDCKTGKPIPVGSNYNHSMLLMAAIWRTQAGLNKISELGCVA